MEVYNITHGVDIDGMSSAAMLVHYRHVPVENVIFINYDDARFDNAVREICGLRSRGNLFVLSDFNANETRAAAIARLFSRLRKGGNRIMWLDHHPWGRKALSDIPRFCDFIVAGENRFRCGAELVYKMLCGRDAFGDRLAGFAHMADFALEPEAEAQALMLKKYAFAITYFNLKGFRECDASLRKLVMHLANGEFKNRLVEGAYRDYGSIVESSVARLLESARTVNAGRYKMAVGFSDSIGANTACAALSKKFRADIALYVDTSARTMGGGLRSSEGIDSSKISFAMGGGGHPEASGFNIRKGAYDFGTERGREKFIAVIKRLADRFYG